MFYFENTERKCDRNWKFCARFIGSKFKIYVRSFDTNISVFEIIPYFMFSVDKILVTICA